MFYPRSLSCKGKRRHKSKGAAEAHLRALLRIAAPGEDLHTYPCAYGPHWHVGHRKETKRPPGRTDLHAAQRWGLEEIYD